MLKNYLKIALRNLWKRKVYSTINILGLAIGLSSSLLIILWIVDEVSYDRFHEKEEQLYRVWNQANFDGELVSWGVTPAPLGPAMQKAFPEVVRTARLNWTGTYLLEVGEKNVLARGNYADPNFLEMFSFPLKIGEVSTALSEPNKVLISESLARKLFGYQNPLGKVLRLEDEDNFIVGGVLQDLPQNTYFDFEILIPWEYAEKKEHIYSSWGNNSYMTFAELSPQSVEEDVNTKIAKFAQEQDDEVESELFLHSVKKWRLYSDFKDGKVAGGRIQYVRLFGIIALFILLIACINFTNLSTAQSEKRIKEVGVRKSVGAHRSSLMLQFLGEAFLMTFLALLIAVLLTELVLPSFNLLTEKDLFIRYDNPPYWLSGMGFVLITSLLAGSYPAFYLSSFDSVKALKGKILKGKNSITSRKVLVVLQFTISIALIISTIVIYRQIQYAKERAAGYDKEQLVYHYFSGDISKNYELIKQELIKEGVAEAVCKTNHPITNNNSNTWGLEWQGQDRSKRILFDQIATNQDFVQTMKIRLKEGRDIDVKEFKTDSTACLLNESAVKVMGFDKPLGQIIKKDEIDYKVVGVIKDFIWGSPYKQIQPMFVFQAQDWYNVLTIRLNSNRSVSENLKKAEMIFKEFNPNYPFNYRFVDSEYNKKFKYEQLMGNLSNGFAGLAIIISCLGLFGLATYTAQARTKEIGIRKVLGASEFSIVNLLSREFLLLVGLAFFIASGIAAYCMHQWLMSFPYRVSLPWWSFLLAGIIALAIALLTVSFQAWKASRANPVQSLRYE